MLLVVVLKASIVRFESQKNNSSKHEIIRKFLQQKIKPSAETYQWVVSLSGSIFWKVL